MVTATTQNRFDSSLLKQFASEYRIDIRLDKLSRYLYSSDASIYQQMPVAVAFPKSTSECCKIIKFAAEHRLPVIARGGGTSLAGQVVGQAIIVDISRYMTSILELDKEKFTVRVQPGVTLSELNAALKSAKLKFAPDPSTMNRANIGGVIGNNAWGAHYPLYGSTREHVLALEVVLSDGSITRFEPLTNEQLEMKKSESGLEGELYSTVVSQLSQHQKTINHAYPHKVPNNMAYAFDVMLQQLPWDEKGKAFNLSSLICGSEGSLAFVTEATLKLVRNDLKTIIVAAHFNSMQDALQANIVAMQLHCSAVELLDDFILNAAQANLKQKQSATWIKGKPKAVLLIEVAGHDERNLEELKSTLVADLKKQKLGYEYLVLRGEAVLDAWNLRRSALGLLMGLKGTKKAVTFIEDSAVPIQSLPGFVVQVENLMQQEHLECVYYGSVSAGLIHLRPLLDITLESDRNKMQLVADKVAEFIRQYSGSMSAKHGDGRVRAPYIKQQLGEEVFSVLKSIKRTFDPSDIFNTGIFAETGSLINNMRMPLDSVELKTLKTYYDWSDQGSFENALNQCNGAAECRRRSSGTMCPSYRVTLEEKDSTRGRANLFRQVLEGDPLAIADPLIHKVLDLCLSCKACRSECPANVDMAKLKAEHLQHYYTKNGTPLRARFIRRLDKLSKLAGKTSPILFNYLANNKIIKKIIGLSDNRPLPVLARRPLGKIYAQQNLSYINTKNTSAKKVVLLNDLFTEYYDVEVGQAAIEVLQAAGYEVELLPCLPSLRTVLSQGLIISAKNRLLNIINILHNYASAQIPIIGLEPAEILSYRDEAFALADNSFQKQQIETVAKHIYYFDEFVALQREVFSQCNFFWKTARPEFYLHGHCHQKSLIGLDATIQTLSLVADASIHEIPSGCCGMAGMFGYEEEHYDISMQIGEQVLFPALRKLDDNDIVVAPGTSCRQQIKHGVQHIALHPAQVLQIALKQPETIQ